ncbi:threonine-phosphate decarboxylase [Pseudosulfitobacter sp. DSM 107133]|uniref:threonine-phosphate decarboxylase n=1 Tax=Pseudosulfitobacter sp. DSM 107133 TaxID=2883100 RepID=UPI000DF35C45|nr:threonine-phosphate decarboxylase [Pseudosulfitobacter sp. DSM 107133]UOA28411.1 Threonine-phosphate decarboxylase [Pseudosulfitobacter sp. DSM 107133]
MAQNRDHGGNLDAAVARFGGARANWVDLSTGINPVPYPVPRIGPDAWNALPDASATAQIEAAARTFWKVPEGADVLAAPGASALIAQIPRLAKAGSVAIAGPTYNEHAAAFQAHGWDVGPQGTAQVLVHPNNPDGRLWTTTDLQASLRVIDESFCDVTPDASLIAQAKTPGTVILKSFGKFWGLAGLRLGFAIGDPALIGALRAMLGPWPVSGIALATGTAALSDPDWAAQTRARLAQDAVRLDDIMKAKGATVVGGTDLFRLYNVDDATAWRDRLAAAHIWSRVFPYSGTWLRLGLPAPDRWAQIEAA